ncbi:MBL fold metallo-hydrolase [Erythrobacter sp. YT30]|uniref:MBL fold metallo-hydrolase n=1 Tax=Erythrobacter sp. YT30 TaxID=1735012 RepID=UPI00076D7E48|nr:MBL fold metallo-hydrolase [Erythrobacter sp. YT30]KWV91609.1 hypothetical protein AUC45_10325 [Erythrobacter sp. YT30]
MRFALATIAAISLSGCGWFVLEDQSTSPESSPADDELALPRAEQPAQCPSEGAAVQILGSGGPIAEGGANARAGTSYLLWIDGEARLLIDAGSGSFLRFAQAGASIADLDAILLTHLHADHAGDLVDVLNSGGFEGRAEPLAVIGPDGAPRFPGTREFLTRLLGKQNGAFSYNGGYLDGTENKPKLQVTEVKTQGGAGAVEGLFGPGDIAATAIPVNHGAAPALGYEIHVGDSLLFITGDQNAFSETFDGMITATRPEIVFAHHVINGEDGQPRGLHRTPAEIGQLAGLAKAKRLVLTHNMERSLSRIESGLEAIGASYDGPVSVADDLDCYAL